LQVRARATTRSREQASFSGQSSTQPRLVDDDPRAKCVHRAVSPNLAAPSKSGRRNAPPLCAAPPVGAQSERRVAVGRWVPARMRVAAVTVLTGPSPLLAQARGAIKP